MKPEPAGSHWLDEHQQLSLMELAELSGLSEVEIRELTEYGIFVPMQPDAPVLTYTAHCVVIARTASRLRDDFELDTSGLAVTLTLLDRLRDLEARIRELEALLPPRTG
ncbi:MAG: chaperone modulator CbpM [Gammaproteobacteria bacterium]